MKTLAAFALLLLTVASCGGPAAEPAPPEIIWGRDVCVECGMILSDPRFAAAYHHSGEDRFFDDIGDMIAYGLRTEELWVTTPAWVHDYHSAIWVEAAAAQFVVAPGLATPMGHGIAAFADPAAARALAAEFGGGVLTWEDLLARPPADEISHEHEG